MFIQLPFLTILAREVLRKKVIKSGFKILIKRVFLVKNYFEPLTTRKMLKYRDPIF